MSSTSLQNQIAAVITFNGVHRRSIELHDGDRLIVGSEESCDIVLNAECVAATHCVIGAEAGVVSVQDCYSESGTFVNGNRIRQTELTGQTELQIGTVNISVAVRNLGSPEPAHQPTNSEAVESRSLSPEDPVELPVDQIEELKKSFGLEPAATASEGHQTDSEDRTVHDLQAQLDDAIAENAVLQNRLESMAATSATPANDPYQEEMIELLRAEVLDLQAALEATAENAVQTPEEVSQHFDDDALPRADAERLVERLEQLLAELQERDEQVATLTSLLEAAERSAQAQQDEKTQLNGWLQDIEQRFGSREQEWQAQKSNLEQTVESLMNERDRAELAISADSSNAKLEAAQNVMSGLRETADALRQQLQSSEAAGTQLRRELEVAQQENTKQEMMELAEQRAEIARQRQELEVARQKAAAGPSDSTLKLQALRQHLNEIHAREEEEKQKEMEERKLSNRIARLWSRMEGRTS